MAHPLEPIFRPSSVAVVGVSADPRKRGHQAMRALLESGYAGAVYPVHPEGGTHFGRVAARTVLEIDAVPDLALVCTPAASVPAVLERCARKGVRGAVVLATGFRESSEEGGRLESQVREIARRTGLRVIGPNTSGILRPSLGLNLVGARGVPPGRLAILTQSGNIALALMNEAVAKTGLGVSLYVGVGNETDLAFHEVLDYLETDSETDAVLMYVEGLREGRAFLDTARRVARTKPIVLLKGGRSPGGCAAVRTHTGALAGSAEVFRAAMRQAGVIEVRRSDELFPVGRALAVQPHVPPEAGVAVLSDGGGHAILAADALSEAGVPLAALSMETRARLRDLLGPAAAVDNPVDLAGASDRDPGIFARVHDALLVDPAVGAVVVVGLFGGYAIRFDPELAGAEVRAAATMAAQGASHRKAWVVHSLYAAPPGPGSPPATRPEALASLVRAGVPVVESPELACRAVAALRERGLFLRAAERPAVAGTPVSEAAPRAAADALRAAAREGRAWLLEPEARALVSAHGVAVPEGEWCASAEAAAAALERLGPPVAMKVVAPAVVHKTEAGGVALGIGDARAARAAFVRLVESARAYLLGRGLEPDVRGVLVTRFLPPPVGELLVGVHRDPTFGPTLTVGAGGTAVEVWRDVSLRVLPADREEILQMLDELRSADLLRGARGRPPADRGAVADLALGLARGLPAHPEIAELEANPVFAYESGAFAVDVRARRTSATADAEPRS